MTEQRKEGHPPRILVVDDEPNVRMMLREALEPLGYEISVAASGEEALSAAADPSVELVLLDLKMPGMDGLEVLERIERERPHLRVVIVTAHGTIDRAVESMKLGALDVIQKPFSVERIRSLVRREMDPDMRSEAVRTRYETHVQRARDLIREHRFDVAVEHVQEAIAETENRPEAFNLAGVIAYIRNERAEAQKQWRLALAHDPTYAPAQENLRRSTRWPREGGAMDLGDSEQS